MLVKNCQLDAYFPKLLEGGQLVSTANLYPVFFPELTRKQSIVCDASTFELVEFFSQFHPLNQLIVDIDSTHFTTYGKQEGVLLITPTIVLMADYPLYAFDGKAVLLFQCPASSCNRYCSEVCRQLYHTCF